MHYTTLCKYCCKPEYYLDMDYLHEYFEIKRKCYSNDSGLKSMRATSLFLMVSNDKEHSQTGAQAF